MNFNMKYSQAIIKHLTAILTAMAIKGFTAKMTDIEEVSEYHRTTISRFLSDDRWDDEPIKSAVKQKSFQHIQRLSRETGAPIFVSLDDTVNVKTKPSSQAARPIEKAEFHHSHLLGKQVWGHQVMAAMISCGKMELNYDIHRYDKTKQSKMAYAKDLISELPIPETTAYFLTDSWYTNGKIIDTCAAKGYHFIGAMKTNRIIYPQGIHISIAEFAAKCIEKNDVNLVTVNSSKYYVYRYEGKLNGIDNAVVLLSWPVATFKNPKTLRAFVCTDTTLGAVTILEYYAQRWCIEVFFGQSKCTLGFGKYQIRSIKGIERLWTIMLLCHLLCTTGLGSNMPFGDGLLFLRKDILKEKIKFIYQSAQKRVPLEAIYALCA
jgi:hypothetical protein